MRKKERKIIRRKTESELAYFTSVDKVNLFHFERATCSK
jgi:hypothetical protein